MRFRVSHFAVLSIGLLSATGAGGQNGDSRLAGRLDSRTIRVVEGIVDSARMANVPTEPLILRALEGASKRAAGPRIESAVRAYANELRMARAALGPETQDADIVAAAIALRNGMKVKELEKYRQAKSGVRLAVAFDALSYLVNQGVSADTATNVIGNLARLATSEETFVALQKDVERDIMGGTPAAIAASVRAQGLERQLVEAAASGNSGRSGSPLPLSRGTINAGPNSDAGLAPGSINGTGGASASDGSRPPAPRGKPKPRP